MERNILIQELEALGLYKARRSGPARDWEFETKPQAVKFTLETIFNNLKEISGANTLIVNDKPINVGELIQQTLSGNFIYNWKMGLKPGIFHNGNAVHGKLDAFKSIVIHETDGFYDNVSSNPNAWGHYYDSWARKEKPSAAHFVILTDGTIIQMYDIKSMLYHASDMGLNKTSIGIEVSNCVFTDFVYKKYPFSEKDGKVVFASNLEIINKKPRDYVKNPYAGKARAYLLEKKQPYKYYIIPPIEQLESLYWFTNILTKLLDKPVDLSTGNEWASIQADSSGFEIGVVKQKSGSIISHSNIIESKFDGWFPALYCFLRAVKGYEPSLAYSTSKGLVSRTTGSVIKLGSISVDIPTVAPSVKNASNEINAQNLATAMPGMPLSRASVFAPILNRAFDEFNIDTPARRNMFLAQVGHESGNFRFLKELGKDDYFKRYEGRKDLGNTQPGDGLKFKGRGAIQITGRTNYEKVGKALGLDLINNPELLEQPKNAVRASAWWWENHGLNKLVDKYPDGVKPVTKIINGGYNGLEDRQRRFDKIRSVLGT